MQVYNAHLVRKHHENSFPQFLDDAIDDTGAHITMDWKMKILSMCFRESQTSFFGKRGISLMGCMVTWRKTADELQAERDHGIIEPQVTKTIFMDLLSDDSSETGFLSSKMLELCLMKIKEIRPHITHCSISTDGAGCFSGAQFFTFLPALGMLTGIRVDVHIVTEVGCGKSELDGHFSYIRHFLIKNVAAGQGKSDFDNAELAAKVLCLNGGIANTMTAVVLDEKSQLRSVSAITGLDLNLCREFQYLEAGEYLNCTSCAVSRMSCRDEDLATIIDIEELEIDGLGSTLSVDIGSRVTWLETTSSSIISDNHRIDIETAYEGELETNSEKKRTKAENKAFKKANPQGLGVTTVDRRKNETAKHNRKKHKHAKRTQVSNTIY